jgi:hypothetical protein
MDENGRFLEQGNANIEIKAGSGIREQMEFQILIHTTDFSIKILVKIYFI